MGSESNLKLYGQLLDEITKVDSNCIGVTVANNIMARVKSGVEINSAQRNAVLSAAESIGLSVPESIKNDTKIIRTIDDIEISYPRSSREFPSIYRPYYNNSVSGHEAEFIKSKCEANTKHVALFNYEIMVDIDDVKKEDSVVQPAMAIHET